MVEHSIYQLICFESLLAQKNFLSYKNAYSCEKWNFSPETVSENHSSANDPFESDF